MAGVLVLGEEDAGEGGSLEGVGVDEDSSSVHTWRFASCFSAWDA